MSTSDSDCSIDWLASDEDEDKGAGRSSLPLPESGGCCGAHNFNLRHASEGNCDAEGSPRCDSPSSHADSFPVRDSLSLPHQEKHHSLSPKRPEKPSGIQPQLARKRPRSGDALEPGYRKPPNGTERDELFADKCRDLHCFIRPLSSILNSLRSGRYRQRLSSFQESTAIDRLQRIMGILQNPGMGERYINILLKVEELLKTWFPNIKPGNDAFDRPEHTCLRKKQKLVSTITAVSTAAAHSACQALSVPHTVANPYSATSLKWLHVSPICSPGPELGLMGLHERLPRRDDDATQDNAVSSSSDARREPPGGRPPQGKINAPCLERLLKSTESIITSKDAGGPKSSSC
ncbi:circadian-associated transcriptional repressor [Brienomyrus brachyistius]|uniref:circadian-associated transcriptional repressor n=1 Tax=Brienomyrus brachyistius TaxID=42636 RepID=UPI0020B1C9A0|nr:circadian-associated transcriptional repressor [Brienomyrus brachyistius]